MNTYSRSKFYLIALFVFVVGYFTNDLLKEKEVPIGKLSECKEFYEKHKKDYWKREGAVEVIYSPRSESCIAANFHNKTYQDAYYKALDAYLAVGNIMKLSENEYRDVIGYDNQSTGIIIDLNRGEVLASYFSEESGNLVDMYGCSSVYESLETKTIFGKKELKSCDYELNLFNQWLEEAERFGFKKWSNI